MMGYSGDSFYRFSIELLVKRTSPSSDDIQNVKTSVQRNF